MYSHFGKTGDSGSKSQPTPLVKTAAFNPIVLPDINYIDLSVGRSATDENHQRTYQGYNREYIVKPKAHPLYTA
jgi:hypothetical protein